MVNGKARYPAALAFLAVTLLTATDSSIAAQDVVPQILPLDEEDGENFIFVNEILAECLHVEASFIAHDLLRPFFLF